MSNTSNNALPSSSRLSVVFFAGVIAVAAIGYLVSITAGVPQPDQRLTTNSGLSFDSSTAALPASGYAEMRQAEIASQALLLVSSSQLPQPHYDLFAKIEPNEEDKLQSLRNRSTLRAYNGAPPVIPHAVDNMDDTACYACHGKGSVIGDRVARRMSHQFLAHCVQCHAPPTPAIFAASITPVSNDFLGALAPTAGHRAYTGAPPTVPHTTWMRNDCLACHGNAAGWAGLESTHPWRAACLQCHAPSAALEQAVAFETQFVPSLPTRRETP